MEKPSGLCAGPHAEHRGWGRRRALYALRLAGLLHPLPTDSIAEPGRFLVAAAIVAVFYVRTRLDSDSDDRAQVLSTIVTTMVFACTPFYRWFASLF